MRDDFHLFRTQNHHHWGDTAMIIVTLIGWIAITVHYILS